MHKTRFISGMLICFLIFSSLFIICSITTVKASEKSIYVDTSQRYPDQADGTEYNPYKTIQDAIAVANDGDVIKVLPGVYSGSIVIDKSITLTCENRSRTILSIGTKDPYAIDITASSVSIEGFTVNDTTITTHRKAVIHISSDAEDVTIINNLFNRSACGYLIHIEGAKNSVVNNNTMTNGSRGIKIENSDSNSIYDNQIENCTSDPAIYLKSSNNNIIEKNTFRNNEIGVRSQSSNNNLIKNNTFYENTDSGIYLDLGDSNSITYNTIYDNTNYGINVGGGDHFIKNNTLYRNNICIFLRDSASYCNITNCSITQAYAYGLYAFPGSANTMIFNNTFGENSVTNAVDAGNNMWDNGTIGNYWDDFYGPDPNNANCTLPVGSSQFYYTKEGVSDRYPKGIYNIEPSISNPNPIHLKTGVARQPVLKVTVVDPDPVSYKERLDVHFYYIGLDESHNLIGSHNNVESGETASKRFSSLDTTGNPAYSYKGIGYNYVGRWYVEVEDQYYKSSSYSRILKTGEWFFSTMNTPVNNKQPIASINVAAEAQVEDEVSFDGSGCNDTDGSIIFYRWSFGDGTNVINEESPTHTYKNSGTYVVSLIVIDNHGASNIAEVSITVTQNTNRAPLSVINGPYTGTAGKSISFSSAGSDDPDIGDSIVKYTWSFGDGDTSTESNPTHKYSLAGNYTVTLTVEDQSGSTKSISTYALIKSSSSSGESPGFEIIFVFIAIILLFIAKKKNKK